MRICLNCGTSNAHEAWSGCGNAPAQIARAAAQIQTIMNGPAGLDPQSIAHSIAISASLIHNLADEMERVAGR